ncbi:MAG: I78 family peptidase inhibitor [Paracoccaceae bacterium]|nr:I78 family peptidase inhibitor [Paracoccaceae bacterium]
MAKRGRTHLVGAVTTALVLTVAQSACQQPDRAATPVEVMGEEIAGNCGLEAYQDLVGLQKGMLDYFSFPERHRIIEPDSAVTMDFVPERLNVVVSEAGVVTDLSCG